MRLTELHWTKRWKLEGKNLLWNISQIHKKQKNKKKCYTGCFGGCFFSEGIETILLAFIVWTEQTGFVIFPNNVAFALGALQRGFELKIKNYLLNRCFEREATKERGRTRLVPWKQGNSSQKQWNWKQWRTRRFTWHAGSWQWKKKKGKNVFSLLLILQEESFV